MNTSLQQIDKVEILTLQDNYIDLTTQDNSDVVSRAMPLKGLEVKNSILAEHGFSAVVTVTRDDVSRSVLFDFGFSEHGAAFNADALGVDMTAIEAFALSHGHLDHVGGIEQLSRMVGKKGIDLVLHPEAFRNPRYLKITDDFKVFFPAFTREKAEAAGVHLVETEKPYPMIGGNVLFLGAVPRRTAFEKGAPNLCYEENGVEKQDPIDDDSALVFNVKNKGLVVLSGCAHAGIVNTVEYAREVTGVRKVFAVMGGFHLTGTDMDTVIAPTTRALKALDPVYIIPTHCTGRTAVMYIEKEMPDKFLLNMSGTRMTFAG